ncbi:MAG: LamG-like jellyroll fold domain-containing protein [Candidatus Nanoarchaeia archaeon]|jgi:hypothetical protein
MAITGVSTGNNDLSISLWYTPTSQPSTDNKHSLIWIGTGTNTRDSVGLAYQNVSDDYYLQFLSEGDDQTESGGQVLNNATAYHLVVTYTSSTNALEFFVNGSSIGTDSLSGDLAISATGLQIILGSDIDGNKCVGTLNDVRFVEKVLSQDNIDFLYNSGSGTSDALPTAETKSKTGTTKSRVIVIKSKTGTTKSRVNKSTSKTGTTKCDVLKQGLSIIGTTKVDILKQGISTTGTTKGRVLTLDKEVTGTTKAQVILIKSVTGTTKSRIIKITSKEGTTKARVNKTLSKEGTTKSRVIVANKSKTGTTKCRIIHADVTSAGTTKAAIVAENGFQSNYVNAHNRLMSRFKETAQLIKLTRSKDADGMITTSSESVFNINAVFQDVKHSDRGLVERGESLDGTTKIFVDPTTYTSVGHVAVNVGDLIIRRSTGDKYVINSILDKYTLDKVVYRTLMASKVNVREPNGDTNYF